ncbi:proline hydroxylase : 2-oxoglutarate-Fe(II) oxygenase family enzyme OS=Microcystis aeruginosa (strain NIES-843) GN=MAE_45110 PE=4 SV=1 [Gemmata massiliana]|uniref:Proline hydroxylase: 2-oxoglutarate-Fe(II) oxygenase family enzyme n=1 Tax=Gemmata massiliana TaxID=1210884 RepID=A0A6P2DHA2_9BACT|nr:2OG-Fe(II) oxygenase [Gemmata massiliana]VTS01062.1 proline hydroxylase : 2-oxoglutarate-Fe(II) oxygenase family enzyme OS=Microcystis aeruginosa (strain NIES-843) GN=MAE_45110 PE=4 SV=1 [Gemmata massiliana]
MDDFIEIYDDALDAPLCEEIVAAFERSGRKARGRTGGGVDVTKKDSLDLNISTDPEFATLHARVLDVTLQYLVRYALKYQTMLVGSIAASGMDPATGKPVALTAGQLTELQAGQLMMKLYRPGQISAQKYLKGVGGYHHWHSEIYPRDTACETLHRVLLFMFYLNTVSDGGETAFFHQNRTIRPQRGRMVIAPAGFTHTHKGYVPLSDDKWILTSWVMFNRAESLYG